MKHVERVLTMQCNGDYYEFGLTCLHAYIRTFELLLHISYKIHVKTWQAGGNEAQKMVKDRNDYICKRFYEEMGLVVDIPK